MKDVGIVGLPDAGAPAVFTALTALPGAAPGKSAQAVVPVPDPRVDTLGELHASKKLVYAQVRFVETSQMVRHGARAGAGQLSAEQIGHLRTTDALLQVVPGDAAEAGAGELLLELVYADLELISGKLERDRKAASDPQAKRALETLERARAVLEGGAALRDERWDELDDAVFQGMGMLTLKPAVTVANVGDGAAAPAGMVAVAADLEAEVAGMEDAEAAELLAGFGIHERALPAVIAATYAGLDLITFLTAGETESRAWEVGRGASAPQAAGVIHSDFERGFIRAEVVAFDELVAAGSWTAARAAGKVRQEGKAYVMSEGDVVEFRFAV